MPAATPGPPVERLLAANDPPDQPAAHVTDQGRDQTITPNADRPPATAAISMVLSGRPAATEAERVWHGLLLWQGAQAAETEGNALDSLPLSKGEVAAAIQHAGPVTRPVGLPQAGPPQAALPLAAVHQAEPEEPMRQHGSDLPPLTLLPGAPPALAGSTWSAPLPAGTVPQLAAAMVATMNRNPDGTTEIALSPDELGSVRLRLEADARDPDRMIVHLVFDRPETMDLFRRHADQLSEAIRAAGYAEARLDFGQSGTGADPQGGQAADTSGPPAHTTASDQARVTPDPGRPFPRSLADEAGLDLRL
jgi:hypothetical protein